MVKPLTVAILGLNVWALLVLLPAFQAPPASALGAVLVISPLPLLAFAARRPTSSMLLLFLFPCSLLLPLTLVPELTSAAPTGPIRLLAGTLALGTYILGALPQTRPRRRVDAPLIAVAAVLPLLWYIATVMPGIAAVVGAVFPGRVDEARTLLSMAAFVIWALLAWMVLAARRRQAS